MSQHPPRSRAVQSTILLELSAFALTGSSWTLTGKAKLKVMPMLSEDPPENDDACGHRILLELRRALVFVLLGPVFGILVALSQEVAVRGSFPGDYVEGCVTVYFFSLVVSVITAPADGFLACVLPIPERGPFTAVIGAAVAVGLSLYWWTQMGNKLVPPSLHWQIPIAIVGGLSMGACSLLSHNYRRSKA